MAHPRRPQVRRQDLRGFKYFRPLLPLLERLHDAGCARDKAHNRTLHYDQFCLLVLLQLYSPAIASLRALQQASGLDKVQGKLGCGRASLGSMSEAHQVFDPELLVPVIAELGGQLQPIAADPRLKDVKYTITLVDGTLLKALPRIAQAMWLTSRTGTPHHAWRLHTQFELGKYVPVKMDLTNGRNSGTSDEKAVLRGNLEPGRCYVEDRWYAEFKLFNDIHAKGSNYVCRVRDNSSFIVLEERPLGPEAVEAGVLRDVVVDLGSSPRGRPDHRVRLVLVKTEPHEKRSGRKGNTGAGPSDGVLRVATDMLDVPAEIVALIYQYRYCIELFFRFFKHVLGCRHLISDDPRGIAIQTYCAIIACMLLALYTGRRPGLRTFEMVGYVLSGMASEAELDAHLAELEERERRAKQRQAEKEAFKKRVLG